MSNITYIDDIAKWRDEFSFFTEIKIRFSETDLFGHMNNVSPFIYFEQARIEFMETIELFNFHADIKEAPVVADLECDYQMQVYFGESIKLYVKTASIGNSSVDLHYMAVKEDGNICFTGRGNLVKINIKTGKSTPLTEKEKHKLINN